jgi:hypothetical protein
MGHQRFLGTSPRPACRRHPDSRVWKDGTYGKSGHRRPRYRCFPRDESRSHVFTELLPRKQAHEGICLYCERPVALHEGAPAPRRYRYAVREIAETLISVGRGTTYRGAARQIRYGTGQRAGNDGRLVTDWLDAFVPCLYLAERETQWPRYVMLDALPFRLTAKDGRPANASAFTILAAMGQNYPSPETAETSSERQLLALRAYPGRPTAQQRGDWIDFLTELKDGLSGEPPVQFVVDLDPMIARAIKTVWPDAESGVPSADPIGPVVWWCHWHVANLLREHLAGAGFLPDTPLYKQVDRALADIAHWEAFTLDIAALRGPRLRTLRNYVRRISPKLAWQVAHRYRYVLASGALESYLADVRSALADRRGQFRNRERLNRLLELMVLEGNGKASVPKYSSLIRAELELNGGFGMPRRQSLDPAKSSSLRV